MSRALSLILVLKNNWKKSTFAAAVVTYGANYAINTYENKKLMREYCVLASKYGDIVSPVSKPFRHITVILNPAANKRHSKELFEKYCAPLLHLAGLAVTVIYTEYAGQAKDIADSIDPKTDALIIAGGDGTLSETITGLLRRVQDNQKVLKTLPLGILPVGRSNSISTALLGNKDEVRALADSAMAIIDGSLRTLDVMKIEPVNNEESAKPIYSLAQMEWGSFRNAKANRDKYWYFGKLREYASCLFTNVEEGVWKCQYIEPCKGCCKCIEKPQINKRWWSFFIPNTAKSEFDYSKIVNENCGKVSEKELTTTEIMVQTSTVSDDNASEAPHLVLTSDHGNGGWTKFVTEGWRRLKGKKSTSSVKVVVREVYLQPKNQLENDWLSIDNENFEVKPMKISVIPKAVNFFQPRATGYV